MATYAFKALDLGSSTKGEIEATSRRAAQLRSKGLIVVDIEEQKRPTRATSWRASGESRPTTS